MAILYGVYAAVLLGGGVMGYVKAQSVPSLVAGIASGIVMIVAAVLLPAQPRTALILGVVTAAVMDSVFALRFARTRKAMPTLPIMAFSIIVLIVSILQLAHASHPHA